MAFELTRKDNTITWKGGSVTVQPDDKAEYSAAEKLIYVASPNANGFTVTSYALNGTEQGKHEYKDKTFQRMFRRASHVSLVYCDHESNGNLAWYQIQLASSGYCTSIIALHRTDKDRKPIEFYEKKEDDSTPVSAVNLEKSDVVEEALA